MNPSQPVVFISGASSGFGRACAAYLHQRGFRVYGTSRRATPPPADPPTGQIVMLPMDVTDAFSVESAVGYVLAHEGRIDVLVNNAGYGIAGALEDTTIEEAQAQLDTNLFGVMRVCRAVLPSMRESRAGLIINMSSIGGLIGLPYQGWYAASKFALEGLSESLRYEVRGFGIDVVLVEPGDFATPFTARRVLITAIDSPTYGQQARKTIGIISADEQSGGSPDRVAEVVYKIIHKKRRRPRYVVGQFMEKVALVIKRVFPYRFFEREFLSHYEIE